MKKLHLVMIAFMICFSLSSQEKQVTIETNVGTMKGFLYDDVPNHVKVFSEKANKGIFDGTLFTRIIKEFMIQGGSRDSRNASAGTRIGSGDPSSEIMPEIASRYFHKKGTISAPRQGDDINPQKKSDMSQFFIVQGKVYRKGELDTLELAKNLPIRRIAMKEFYQPVKEKMEQLKTKDPREYNKYVVDINHKVDSVIRSTPGHLLFSEEQREALMTIGGTPHLDGEYTTYGEITEGLDIIDLIANQPRDANDRPTKDIRIIRIRVE